jgi:hypothetical protein
MSSLIGTCLRLFRYPMVNMVFNSVLFGIASRILFDCTVSFSLILTDVKVGGGGGRGCYTVQNRLCAECVVLWCS